MEELQQQISQAWDTPPEDGKNPVFERILANLEESGSAHEASYASALNEYASWLRVNGLYVYGAAMFLRALDAIAALDGKRTAYATCLSNYAELCRLAGDFTSCEAGLAEAKPLYEDKESIEYATNLNYWSNLRQSQERPREAAQFLADSLSIVERISPGTINLATAHQNLGGIYLQMRQPEEALANLKKALDIYEGLGAQPNAHLVSLFNTMAMVHIMLSQLDDAERAFDSCLETMRACKMNPDDIALVRKNAVDFYERRGKPEKAAAARA